MAVLDLCTTSNVGDPGVWRLSPRGTAIMATCGNGFRETGETCDDGNTMEGDGCSAMCRTEVAPVCGDGTRDRGEECDDGNTRNGDGCDRSCLVELGPCDPAPATRDASARPDASCNDAGPPQPADAAIDAGPDVPVLEGGGCACRAACRGLGGSRSGALGLGLVLASIVARRRRGARVVRSRAQVDRAREARRNPA
ncbi:MAG: DUF4215 domain-containing protein [Sandaracinaceae bacterium]|nr:DUF4215 domain-containing protein [Sandaracinaceae bacterium]